MDKLTDEQISVTLKYINCACNRVPHCLDWGDNNLVCFGANNSVAIYDTSILPYGKVTRTLHLHKQNVKVVQWIKPSDNSHETEMISASTDGTVAIWSNIDNLQTDQFEISSILNIGEPLTICTTIAKNEELLIFVSTINGKFQIWNRIKNCNNETSLRQEINLNNKLALEAKCCILPENHDLMLAIALENATIQIFVEENSVFVPTVQLLGHEDWVTCLDFVVDYTSKQVLLASGSQDHFIRLWKISFENEKIESNELQMEKQIIKLNNQRYEVTLESVLCGHSGWIYGLHWWYDKKESFQENLLNSIKLLSASLDKTMIIWQHDSKTGIWTESIRVGDVGGNSLGFYGCKFGRRGKSILAHGFHGSLYRWEYSQENDNWIPLPAPTGHFGEVVDLLWDKYGRYLITASVDQTTRVHAPWILDKNDTWYEISRPQIHGYNMSCIAMITPNTFAFGAEEKVARIFVPPLTFQKYLNSITKCNKDADENADNLLFDVSLFKNLALSDDSVSSNITADSASVPALGLTNKAVFKGSEVQEESLSIGSSAMLDYSRPPLEEELVQHTLWPEIEKLYGHGYELFSVAATSDGEFLATASKSTSYEHAAIILWDTKTWSQIQKLHFHQLTITQLEFSKDNKYLLAVSRDRKWSLYERKDNFFEIVASMKKDCLHKRIIWCCSWTNDSQYFATGSRDGKIGIWNVNDVEHYQSLETSDSVTALSFAQSLLFNKFYVLAVGFESGMIDIYIVNKTCDSWKKVMAFDMSLAHHLTVKRLKFRPVNIISNKFHLASCSSDNTVKVYELDFSTLSSVL